MLPCSQGKQDHQAAGLLAFSLSEERLTSLKVTAMGSPLSTVWQPLRLQVMMEPRLELLGDCVVMGWTEVLGSGVGGGGYSRETLICYGTRLLLGILSCSE